MAEVDYGGWFIVVFCGGCGCELFAALVFGTLAIWLFCGNGFGLFFVAITLVVFRIFGWCIIILILQKNKKIKL